MLRSVQIVDTDGSNATVTESYMYNANGQRTIKDTDGVLTKYFYSGSTVLITADQSNNKLTENIVDLSGAIISSKRFSGTEDWYSYNYDIRSSTTAILDGTGALKKGYQYDAFGNASSSGTLLNETSFTGAISDVNTGLYYMNARYYNSNTGRFISQDSYKGSAYSPWTQNLYTYTGNNPVNFVDPTGHYAWYAQPALIDGTHLNQPLYYTGSNSGGSSVVPEPDDGAGSQANDDLCESIVTEFIPGPDDEVNPAQLTVAIDSDDYSALIENTGSWYNAAYYLGSYIMQTYGDKFVDPRTPIGVATEAFIHYQIYNEFNSMGGVDDFVDKLIVQSKVLNVVYSNDDSNIIAEKIANYVRKFPKQAELILTLSSAGYVINALRDPEGYIQND